MARPYTVLLAMLVFSGLAFGVTDESTGAGTAILVAAISYFLAVYLYYGTARLAFEGRQKMLWFGGGLAIIVGLWLSGSSGFLPVVFGWLMILVAGAACARLALAGKSASAAYIVGMLIVAILFTAQFGGFWPELMASSRDAAAEAVKQLEPLLASIGYNEQQINDNILRTKAMFDAIIRLTPAFTILSAGMQFSLGFLLFARYVAFRRPEAGYWVPFTRWRIPFAVMPAVIVAVLMRVVGNEPLKLAADNILAGLSVYYCVAGLSLIEYHVRRLAVTVALRIMFYVFLTLALLTTHVFGFFAAALLGFIDSFADWRKEPEVGVA